MNSLRTPPMLYVSEETAPYGNLGFWKDKVGLPSVMEMSSFSEKWCREVILLGYLLGIVAKGPLGCPTSHLLAPDPGRKQAVAQVFGPHCPCGRPRWSFQLLALTWHNASYRGHLESEPVIGAVCLSLFSLLANRHWFAAMSCWATDFTW